MDDVLLSVSDFVALTNQTLEYAYPLVQIEGEVAEFRVAQGKWVSFKLKDDAAVVNCFTALANMRIPLQDGMRVIVVAAPRLNNKGYFNLNLRAVKPVGEGSIKKSFDLLVAKLEKEGLFAVERKRLLPRVPQSVAVIASTESAGYADFVKILNSRWGGLQVSVAHVQVQGDPAPDQMIRAINYFNNAETLPDVLVIIRGGGSAEDLSTFNDEPLVRAIAASRIPTMVGVGHEVDHTLADMVSDVRAATPSNAAQLLVPYRHELIRTAKAQANSVGDLVLQAIDTYSRQTKETLVLALQKIDEKIDISMERLNGLRLAVEQLNPENVLRRGYALLKGPTTIGATITIETIRHIVTAEVKDVKQK